MILYICSFSVVTLVLIFLATLLYRYVRPKFSLRVSCWFCGADNVVPYGNKNCWDCPSCDQYNGFKEDGDYNKPIPAQYNDDLNHPIQCKADHFNSNTDVLCNDCSLKQLLKTRMLANFIPINEANFEAEVEEYEQQLENSTAYGLCFSCHARVSQELWQQDQQIQQKLQQANINKSCTSDYEIDKSAIGTDLQDGLSLPLDLIFGLMSLFCEVILFGIVIHRHGWTSPVLIPVTELFLPQTNSIAVSGLIFSVFAKLYLGKDRLAVIDGLNCPLWMVIVIFEHGYIEYIFGFHDNQTYIQIGEIFIAVNFYVSLDCVLMSRKSRSAPSYNIKRLSLESSSSSRTSDVTNTNSIPLTSVSQQSHRSQMTSFSQHQNRQTHILKHDNPQKSSAFQKVNPFLDDTLSEFGLFSLGSSIPRRSSSGVFSTSFSQAEVTSSSSISNVHQALRKPRPLISPAKFQIPRFQSSTPSKFSTEFTTLKSTGIYSENYEDNLPTFGSSCSLLNRNTPECGPAVNNISFKPIRPDDFNDTDSNHSKSSVSSVCPVDSTTKIEALPKQAPFWKNSGFVGFALGSSLVSSIFMSYLYIQKT